MRGAESFRRRAGLRLPADHHHYLADSRGLARSDLTRALLFYRANESDHPSWSGGFGTSYLGHGSTGSLSAGLHTLVACLLSFCAPPRITTDSAWTDARTRWQVSGATKPPAYSSHGSRKNQPTMDGAGSAVLSLTASAMLHNVSVNEARRRHAKWLWAAR